MTPSTRPTWIWPFRIPGGVAARTLHASRSLADWLGPTHRWVLAGALVGGLPILVDAATGWPSSRLVTALVLTPFLAGALARDWLARGLLFLAAAFAAHSALAIALTAGQSEVIGSLVVE